MLGYKCCYWTHSRVFLWKTLSEHIKVGRKFKLPTSPGLHFEKECLQLNRHVNLSFHPESQSHGIATRP